MNRRSVIAFVGSGIAVAAGALGYEAWRAFGKHYPPTPYDDLLDLLSDREAAKRVGATFLQDHADFTPPDAVAALRRRIGHRPLASVLEDETTHGELTEAGHWLVPQTLAGLCALAAKT
jgi:hypothetical protein